MKSILIAVLLLSACQPAPPEPSEGVHSATTNPCYNPPWLGWAKLGPTNPQGGYYVFAVPQSDPGTQHIQSTTFLNYYTSTYWQNTCLWQDPFDYAHGGAARYFDSMFYIWGAYAEVWLKVYNNSSGLYECWNLSLDQNTRSPLPWGKYDCGYMTLDSYAGAVWSTPIYN